MRILVLNWRDIKNPTKGGAEMVVDNIINGLASLGHEVTLFTSAFRGCKKEERHKRIMIVRRGSINTVYLHAFHYYIRHRRDFDFIIESVSAVPFFTPLYADSRRIIIIPHHIVGKVVFKELGFPKSIIAYTAESSIPHLYGKVRFVAISKAVRSELIRFGVKKGNIGICYFGAPLVFKPVRLRKYDRPTLVTVSRLMRYKRVDVLLQVLKGISSRIDARLIVVSSGKELQNLKRYAATLGLNKKVKFVGRVSEREKAKLLARSWVYVSASEREGFGVSALEAEMCGTPVVGFRVGGLSEAVQDKYSGFLVREGDKKEFELRLLDLLENKKLRERFSNDSIEFSKRFDSRRAIEKLDKMIRESIARKG